MKYYIHFGKLYRMDGDVQGPCLCSIKGPLYSASKKILSADGALEFQTGIAPAGPEKKAADRKYFLKNSRGEILAEGQLGYAKDTDPWPVSHAPRADHLNLFLSGSPFTLRMLNSQNFAVTDPLGNKTMEFIHDGTNGGWNVTADKAYDAMTVMGIFLFCRGLDKENEFVVV